jgi:hypothetical protein
MRLSTAIALSLVLMSPMALAQVAAPAAPSSPPSAAQMQLALKLYDDTHVESVFDGIASNLVTNELGAAQNVAGAKSSCTALRAPAKAFVDRIQPLLSNLADAGFRQSAATVYANNLSEQELRDITNFLESSAGKKWNTVSGQVNQQIMQIASEKAKPRESQVRAAVTDFESSFKTALATCPAGAATPMAPAGNKPPVKKH